MTNENCLKGMRCPHCCSEGPFEIAMEAIYLMSDEGTEDVLSDMDYDMASYCGCRECGNAQTVADFYSEENEDA